jgi:hypothetical protein
VRIVRPSRSWALALPIAILASGCYTMKPIEKTQLSANPDVQRIWVTTRHSHSAVILDRPEVVGDTIDGSVAGHQQRIALSDVATIETRTLSGSKTRNLVLGIVVVGAGATVALLNSNNSQPKNGLCYEAADLPPVNCCLVQVSNGNSSAC